MTMPDPSPNLTTSADLLARYAAAFAKAREQAYLAALEAIVSGES